MYLFWLLPIQLRPRMKQGYARQKSGRERHGTGTGTHLVFRSRPRVPDPSVLDFCSVVYRTIPSYGVFFPPPLFAVPLLSAHFTTVSLFAQLFPSNPDVRKRFLPFHLRPGFLGFLSYDHGCNWTMQLWMEQQYNL